MNRTAVIGLTTPGASAWLHSRLPARILHLFENSCSLANSEGHVISIVNPQIGRGPFNLVLAESFAFLQALHADSAVHLEQSVLRIGDQRFETSGAAEWDPRPGWERLQVHGWRFPAARIITDEIASFPTEPGARPNENPFDRDADSLNRFALELAGRGPGLTPSGDDFLIGWMHAAWLLLPANEAADLCRQVAATAIPRTTTLSAAWLRAARDGLAGAPWHTLFEAMLDKSEEALRRAARVVLQTGHSSGVDALTGFLEGVRGFQQRG